MFFVCFGYLGRMASKWWVERWGEECPEWTYARVGQDNWTERNFGTWSCRTPFHRSPVTPFWMCIFLFPRENGILVFDRINNVRVGVHKNWESTLYKSTSCRTYSINPVHPLSILGEFPSSDQWIFEKTKMSPAIGSVYVSQSFSSIP